MRITFTDFASHKVEEKEIPDTLIRAFVDKILAMSLGSMTANVEAVGELTCVLRRDIHKLAKPVEAKPDPALTALPPGFERITLDVSSTDAADLRLLYTEAYRS